MKPLFEDVKEKTKGDSKIFYGKDGLCGVEIEGKTLFNQFHFGPFPVVGWPRLCEAQAQLLERLRPGGGGTAGGTGQLPLPLPSKGLGRTSNGLTMIVIKLII